MLNPRSRFVQGWCCDSGTSFKPADGFAWENVSTGLNMCCKK